MPADAKFLFVTCQVGAETPLKEEVARLGTGLRFAYSRPGFVTFKLPAENPPADDFELGAVFARAYGYTLGKVAGTSNEDLAREAWKVIDSACGAQRLHVWERDERPAGERGYEPGLSSRAVAAREALVAAAPSWAEPIVAASPTAKPGELVLDCVVVNPQEWWIGYHRARRGPSCAAGGFAAVNLPADVVSRAYLKTEEAVEWADFPIKAGHHVVELGCAPGGSCQALLERGLIVTGIDPGAMHEAVLAHPNFTHVRKRAADVRRREFRKTRWLLADMNVAPDYTLDAVEGIVTHAEVHVEGLLLTLKLADWALAAQLPQYVDRIRSWGYTSVTARQLHHGRQEVCVAALAPPKKHKRGGRSIARPRLRH